MVDRASSRTAAVVLNWNGGHLTRQCLRDLGASERPLHVVVVDNGSTDGSGDSLRVAGQAGPELVRLARNRGFSAGMNAGMRHVRSGGYEYLWLLNNDVSIPPAAHGALVSRIESTCHEVVLSPRLVGPDGSDQHVGGSYARDGSSHRLLRWDQFPTVPADGTWLTGTALFCRTSTASRIGDFDERFFAYWEDVDWSFRARALGVRLEVASDVAITHLAGQGRGGHSPLATFLSARNELLFTRRHLAGRARAAACARILARQWRLATLLSRHGGEDLLRARFAGLTAGLLGLHGRPRRVPLPRFALEIAMANPLARARWLERIASRLEPPAAHHPADTAPR